MSTSNAKTIVGNFAQPASLLRSNGIIQHQQAQTRLAQQGLMFGLEMQGNTLKLRLVGNLTKKQSAYFKAWFNTLLEQDCGEVEFDFSNLQKCDAAGVATLAWVQSKLGEHNGHLTLSHLSAELRSTLFAINFQYLVNFADYSLAA